MAGSDSSEVVVHSSSTHHCGVGGFHAYLITSPVGYGNYGTFHYYIYILGLGLFY